MGGKSRQRRVRIHACVRAHRSGSTALLDLLNQRDDVQCTGTVDLSRVVMAFQEIDRGYSGTAGWTSNPLQAQQSGIRAMRGMVEGFFLDDPDATIIMKDAGWGLLGREFHNLWPDGHIIVCVRDVRDILASIAERDEVADLSHPYPSEVRTLAERLAFHLSPGQPVAESLRAVVALGDTSPEWAHLMIYERWMKDPRRYVDALTDALGLPPFDYDVDACPYTSTDVDALTRFRFPHRPTPEEAAVEQADHRRIGPPRRGTWRNVAGLPQIMPDLMRLPIVAQYHHFYSRVVDLAAD